MARFGIEEEFVLLDEDTLVPLGINDAARERLSAAAGPGRVTSEYLTCQLECVTDPVTTRMEADLQIRRMRALLGTHASDAGAVAAATGTPYATTHSLAVSPSPHYDDVAANLAHITRDHEVNGLHVHVEVTDDEERIRALNRIRGWLPTLLALTGNAPFANGLRSGFASWRSILIRRLPASWCPPRFQGFDDYQAHVAQLIELRAIAEPASLSWAVRLSERFPTVEVRVFDTQLTPEDTLFAALLTRAIANSDDRLASRGDLDGIDASLWMAARNGMDSRVVEPTTGEVTDAWTAVERLMDAVRPVLADLGDLAFVEDHLEFIRTVGTGAARQLRAFERDGIDGLRRLYREGTPTTAT